MHSRYEIHLEDYCKVLNIEALTILELVKKDIIPSVYSYIKDLSDTANAKTLFISDLNCDVEKTVVTKLSLLVESLYKKTELLDNALIEAKNYENIQECAEFYRRVIFNGMQELRAVVDELEVNTASKYWPFPTYGDLVFSV
jgi:glutamine synthetase